MSTPWENTQKALKEFARVLTCNKCKGKPVNPKRFNTCGHFFCEACVGNESECAVCVIPVQPIETHNDYVVKNLVAYCDAIAEVMNATNPWPKSKKSSLETSLSSAEGKLAKTINKQNMKGETRLHIACISLRKDREEAVKALLDAGANPNTKDYSGWTPLQEAVNYGFTDVCQLLLKYGAHPDTPGIENRRPLHDAVIEDRLEAARLLLQYSAQKDVCDNYGKKPIDYCKPGSEMWELLNNEIRPFETPSEATGLDHSLNQSMRQPGTIVMYASDLKEEHKRYLQKMGLKHKFKIESTFKPCVTHVVVEANSENIVESSFDVMLALLRGCWLINTHWIQLNMDLNDILNGDLEIFEVSGAPHIGVPRRARENAQYLNPRLFDNCHFYFDMEYHDLNAKTRLKKEDLMTLVSKGAGTVLKREPNPSDLTQCLIPFHVAGEPTHSLYRCTHYTIYTPSGKHERVRYNMAHIKSLPVVWLIECIEKFTLVDPVQLGLYTD